MSGDCTDHVSVTTGARARKSQEISQFCRVWTPVDEFRGVPGTRPMLWWHRGVRGIGPQLDMAILDMDGRIMAKMSGVAVVHYLDVMPVEQPPEPPVSVR